MHLGEGRRRRPKRKGTLDAGAGRERQEVGVWMRLTVLRQQNEPLQAERPQPGDAVSKDLDSVKHLLWHGNVEEALERLENQTMDLDLMRAYSGERQKPGGQL